MTHTLQDNILGEIHYGIERWQYKYYFSQSLTDFLLVTNIVKMQAMKTGCTVLHCEHEKIVVVSPGYRYCVQSRMES